MLRSTTAAADSQGGTKMEDTQFFGGRTAGWGGKVHLFQTRSDGRVVMACGCPNSQNGRANNALHSRCSINDVNCRKGAEIIERALKAFADEA